MLNKEKEQQRNKKSIVAEVIYSEKSSEIFNHIQKIKEELDNFNSKFAETNLREKNPELSKLFHFLTNEIECLGEQLMRQDIRVSIATGLIDHLRPYPIKERLEEVNKEIENRINSKNFPH